MNPSPEQTTPASVPFDFSAFPADTLFLDRRTLPDRRNVEPTPPCPDTKPRVRKERRRRIDPTTFEKQYTDDQVEFMNAVQDFKLRSGKMFPSHGDILRVALTLGYRKLVLDQENYEESSSDERFLAVAGCEA